MSRKENTIQLYGYSERGMVFTMFTEVAVRNAPGFLTDILNYSIGLDELAQLNMQVKSVLIEPSFSDFGDPDVVVLLQSRENSGQDNREQEHLIVFVEAKTNSYPGLQKEYAQRANTNMSNLFNQIRLKKYFVELLRNTEGGPNTFGDAANNLQWEKRFLKHGKRKRSLGNNKLVLRYAEMIRGILKMENTKVMYLAIVPEVVEYAKHNRHGKKQCSITGFLADKKKNEELSACRFISWGSIGRLLEKKYKNTLPLSRDIYQHNKVRLYNWKGGSPH